MVNGASTICECRGVLLAAIVDVASVGLPVMALLIAAESMGVPLPGETALIAAAVLASRGHFPIEAVIVLAATAAIVGDNLGFAISRRYGRSVIMHPRVAHHGERLLAVGEPFFEKHGPKTVFLGRWVAGLRIGAAWLAGLNGMRWPSFLFWNATGGIFLATTVGLGAYWLGPPAGGGFQNARAVGARGWWPTGSATARSRSSRRPARSAPARSSSAGSRRTPTSGCAGAAASRPRRDPYASIAGCSAPSTPICTLRGLRCSGFGILISST